jgi:phospholipase/carboxylesterase
MSLVHSLRHPAGSADRAVVLVHGMGGSGEYLAPLLDHLDPQRRALGVLLQAPHQAPGSGWSWYDGGHNLPDPQSFADALDALVSEVGPVLAEAGLSWRRTVLIGYSQGAILSYALALGRGRPEVAALAALSGFIPDVAGQTLDLDRAAGLSVAQVHGTNDDVIPLSWAHKDRELLASSGAMLWVRELPIAHTVDLSVGVPLRGWLAGAATQNVRPT